MRRSILALVFMFPAILAVACAPAAAPSPTTASKPASQAAPAQPAAEKPASAAPTQPPKRETVRLGNVSPSALQWAEFTADRIGFFEAENLDVQMTFTGSAAGAAQQLAAGSLDIANSGSDPFLRAIEANAPITLISADINPPPYSINVASSISDWQDLKGKRVIIGGVKDPTMYFWIKMLEPQGLKVSDMEMVYAGSTKDRYSALAGGSVQAAMLTQPFDFQATEDGFKSLGWTGDYVKEYLFIAAAVNKNWAASHEDALVRYLRAVAKAMAWLHDPQNKNDAINVIAEVAKLDQKVAAQTYDLYLASGKDILVKDIKIREENLRATIESRAAIGDTLPSPMPPMSAYYDGSYLEKARATMN